MSKMNYSQDQIEALIKEARDRERARCVGIIRNIRDFHATYNPAQEGPLVVLDAAIKECES